MKTILYPGSFDPFTNGHLDLVERASVLFDRVIVAVAINSEKHPMFTIDERRELIKQSCKHIKNAEVLSFDGLLVDAIINLKAEAVLRGLRAFSDFEYELQLALMNKSLQNKCETIFMMPSLNYSFVSSRMVKEVALLGGNFEPYVPAELIEPIRAKVKK